MPGAGYYRRGQIAGPLEEHWHISHPAYIHAVTLEAIAQSQSSWLPRLLSRQLTAQFPQGRLHNTLGEMPVEQSHVAITTSRNSSAPATLLMDVCALAKEQPHEFQGNLATSCRCL